MLHNLMEIIPPSDSGLDPALHVLRRGGTVVHATETCYGLTADLKNAAAIRRLFDIKNRPYDMPVSGLFVSMDEACAFVDASPRAMQLAEKYFPGPLTLVLPKKQTAPPLWVTVSGEGADAWIGVRISSHRWTEELVRSFGSPLATTSANIHGEANPYDALALAERYTMSSLSPDIIIDSGVLPEALPSTVIRVDGDTVTVLRQGALVVV